MRRLWHDPSPRCAPDFSVRSVTFRTDSNLATRRCPASLSPAGGEGQQTSAGQMIDHFSQPLSRSNRSSERKPLQRRISRARTQIVQSAGSCKTSEESSNNSPPPKRYLWCNKKGGGQVSDNSNDNRKVWFITGAGRGMGADFARAALAAGHAVVATGRDPERVAAALGQSDDLLAVTARRHQPRRCRSGGARRGRSLRPHRRAGQQRRQLLRRLLRGADTGADRPAVGHEPHRPDERHPRRPAGHAQATLGTHHLDLLVRRPRRRLRLRHRLRRIEVRPRRVDGVAARRGRAVRHHTPPSSTPASSAPNC